MLLCTTQLLDDLEDDATPGPDEAVELVDKVVDDTDAVDVDDDLLVADPLSTGDLDADLKADELLAVEAIRKAGRTIRCACI